MAFRDYNDLHKLLALWSEYEKIEILSSKARFIMSFVTSNSKKITQNKEKDFKEPFPFHKVNSQFICLGKQR